MHSKKGKEFSRFLMKLKENSHDVHVRIKDYFRHTQLAQFIHVLKTGARGETLLKSMLL